MAQKIAENSDFQLAGYCFEADKESTRAPRVVRIGNHNQSQNLPGKVGQQSYWNFNSIRQWIQHTEIKIV